MKQNKKKLKQIKNIFEAITAYIFYYIFLLFPVTFSSKIGYFLGSKLIPFFSKDRKKEAIKNIMLAFPQKTKEEAKEIFIKSCGFFGSSVLEMPRVKDLLKRVNLFDEHNILESIGNNKSLVFSAHYGCWELFSTQFVNTADICYSIYKKPSNPFLEKFFLNFRSKLDGMKLITLNKQRLVSLNNEIKHKNINISMLVDQKIREGIKVHFFGRAAYTSTFLPLFALKYNIPLIPVKVLRTPNLMINIILEKPLDIEKTGNKKQDIKNLTRAMNQKIEKWITEDPTQWLWLHKRW